MIDCTNHHHCRSLVLLIQSWPVPTTSSSQCTEWRSISCPNSSASCVDGNRITFRCSLSTAVSFYISCDKRMNVVLLDTDETSPAEHQSWPEAWLKMQQNMKKNHMHAKHDILLASINFSRGLKSDEDNCSLTLATSFGCRMSNQLWPSRSPWNQSNTTFVIKLRRSRSKFKVKTNLWVVQCLWHRLRDIKYTTTIATNDEEKSIGCLKNEHFKFLIGEKRRLVMTFGVWMHGAANRFEMLHGHSQHCEFVQFPWHRVTHRHHCRKFGYVSVHFIATAFLNFAVILPVANRTIFKFCQ